MVFKGYDLIYGGGTLTPQTAFLKFLVAASLPLVALYITWKTFKYATPLTAKVVGVRRKGLPLLVVSRQVRTSVAPASRRLLLDGDQSRSWSRGRAESCCSRWSHQRRQWPPSYRRTENDPSGATAEASSTDRGMEFDRGIH